MNENKPIEPLHQLVDNIQTETVADPVDEAKQAHVEQIIRCLDDGEIREAVFRQLHVCRQLPGPTCDAQVENASHLAFRPELFDLTNEAFKQKAREEIRVEICGLQNEIDQNTERARKLMNNSVWYAKSIGDRLLYVKWHLVAHGEYEQWVEANFYKGLSTARAYTKIAKLKNWKKIAPKLTAGRLTLEAALALLRKHPADEPDSGRQKHTSKLLNSYKASLRKLPDEILRRRAKDFKLPSAIESASANRDREIEKAIAQSNAEDDAAGDCHSRINLTKEEIRKQLEQAYQRTQLRLHTQREAIEEIDTREEAIEAGVVLSVAE